MHRGKAIQPERDCDYCGNPLPTLRHPGARYCNPTCRQRDRYQREHAKPGLPCLDCGKIFTRVGSHVVQVHGYESVAEYRQEHGLMAKETRADDHAQHMHNLAMEQDRPGLQQGAPYRYRKGGDHGKTVTEFWRNRKRKAEYGKVNSNLRGKK